jgi:pSer/pThr/pTyr-binding forkhead associated (FHA) protein
VKVFYLEYLGYSVELPLGETVVGRDIRCGVRFNDSAISRRHLRFVREADAVTVEDLGSMNGTLKDGAPIVGMVALKDADTIVIGNRSLKVRIVSDFDDEPSTRRLESLANLSVVAQRDGTQRSTKRLADATFEHCPRCGAAVGATAVECARCKYRWGNLRSMRLTVDPLDRTDRHVIDDRSDRRRSERHSIELPVVYASQELEIEVMTRDLSHTGLFVCSQVLEPLGTRCELTILVEGGPPVRLHGVVRRVVDREQVGGEPVGLGIEFVNIGANERAWLDIAIAQMSDSE